ncbi:MAG: hypothetical protein WEE89_20070 [Gemmatimonadota bacterium]
MTRFLQSTVRQVKGDCTAYRAAWSRVGTAAASANARAWIFHSVQTADTHIEFIEWKSMQESDSTMPPQITAALAELEQFGPGEPRLWQEP